jgi:hypothetical protein
MPKPHDLVFFVSPVAGRLVSRPGAPHAYIGARITTAEERAEGAEPFVWDLETVVPFSAPEFQRYERELRAAVRRGDLVARSAEDFTAWGKAQEQREAARVAKPLPGPEPGGDLPPFDGSVERQAEGTGTENTAVAAPADGTPTELEPDKGKRKAR